MAQGKPNYRKRAALLRKSAALLAIRAEQMIRKGESATYTDVANKWFNKAEHLLNQHDGLLKEAVRFENLPPPHGGPIPMREIRERPGRQYFHTRQEYEDAKAAHPRGDSWPEFDDIPFDLPFFRS